MLSPLFLCVLAGISATAVVLQRRKGSPLPCFVFCTLVLPFAAGGFHGYVIGVSCVAMLVFLLLRVRKNGCLTLSLNLGTVAAASLFLFSFLTPLWAADRGMAPFGILRWASVLVFALYLTQCDDEEKGRALDLIPLCGGLMTAVSLVLLLFPQTKQEVTVNARLAGFFQYPNTYALFLLAGILLRKDAPSPRSRGLLLLLMTGIVLSGSRTVFILLIIALLGSLLIQKDRKEFLADGICLLLAIAAGQVFSHLGLLANADRYTEISPQAGTFLVRLLYDKDALKLILSHPFGLGYLGYRAMEGSIQTGRYYVTFVHNGFFQLLLDLGWIPGLLMGAALISSLLSPRISPLRRLLLALILMHSLLDYDTEFFSVWVLLLGLMDLSGGKQTQIKAHSLLLVPAAAMMVVTLWLSAGEWCYYSGQVSECLTLTPFHTDARVYQLSRQEDPLIAESLADEILEDHPRQTLALTAKAGAAFYRGDMKLVMGYMEEAISCDRYNIDLYCNYIQKLYTAAQIYQQSGNRNAASACIGKLLEIPEKMAAVEASSDPLAWKTGDDPDMVLPEEYLRLIESLNQIP